MAAPVNIELIFFRIFARLTEGVRDSCSPTVRMLTRGCLLTTTLALVALLATLHFSFVGQTSELADLIRRAATTADASGGFHVLELDIGAAGSNRSFWLPNGTLMWTEGVEARSKPSHGGWEAVAEALGLPPGPALSGSERPANRGEDGALRTGAAAIVAGAPPAVVAVAGLVLEEALPLVSLFRAAISLAWLELPPLEIGSQGRRGYHLSRQRGHLYLADEADEAAGSGGAVRDDFGGPGTADRGRVEGGEGGAARGRPVGSLWQRRARLAVPLDTPGLGGPLARVALRMAAAEDIPVVWAAHAATAGDGFLRARPRGRVLALSKDRDVAAMRSGRVRWLVFKVGTLCSALFVVFAAMGLASFVFTETQRRMVRFTLALGHAVRRRRPVLRLVLAHSIESLVFVPIIIGLLFFLFEFFADKLLAFLVFMTLWACEVFAVVACRTVQTVRAFPVAALLTLTWLMVYVLAFPFGLHHLALACVCAAVTTTGFHQWTAFELPALEEGRLSEAIPRETIAVSPAQGMTADLVRSLERGGVLGAGLGLGGGRMPVRAVLAGMRGTDGHDPAEAEAEAAGERPAAPSAAGAAPEIRRTGSAPTAVRRRHADRGGAETLPSSSAEDAMGNLLDVPAVREG